MKAQAFKIDSLKVVIKQDNQSAIKLENNGRWSVGKRSRHLDIRCFFITDMVQKGKVNTEHCPTDDMTADHLTKPVQGAKHKLFWSRMMGEKSPIAGNWISHECQNFP